MLTRLRTYAAPAALLILCALAIVLSAHLIADPGPAGDAAAEHTAVACLVILGGMVLATFWSVPVRRRGRL